MLIAHTNTYRYLAEALKNASLAHAYGLVGKNQIGKRTLARQFVADLLKTTPEKLETNPDFVYVTRLTDEKTGKKRTEISVTQARELKNQLERLSWAGGYRVFVIDEAEFLSTEAGNALLKLLEEPPAKSILLMLLENDAALLPTIRSRIQLLYLSVLSDEVLVKELAQAGYKVKEVEAVLPFAYGRPGKAIELLINNEERKRMLDEQTRFKNLKGKPFFAQIELLKDLFEEIEGERTQEKISEILDAWSLWSRAELAQHVERSETAAAAQTAQTIDILQQSKVFLKEQVNARLVLENAVRQF